MITVEQFDALKTKQAVKITLKACMGGLSEKTLYVGRRTKSKKYRVESLTLNREPGKAAPAHLRNLVKITLYKRNRVADGKPYISASIGDMAATVSSFEVIPNEELTIHQRLKIAGCKLGSHESDLYVEKTPKALKAIKSHPNPWSFEEFRCEKTGDIWLDLPAANDCYWSKKARGGQ